MLGNKIKTLRKERKMTMSDLSKKSKVSQSYISDLENGKNNRPSLNIIKKLALALGVPISEIVEEEIFKNPATTNTPEKMDSILITMDKLKQSVSNYLETTHNSIPIEFLADILNDLTIFIDALSEITLKSISKPEHLPNNKNNKATIEAMLKINDINKFCAEDMPNLIGKIFMDLKKGTNSIELFIKNIMSNTINSNDNK